MMNMQKRKVSMFRLLTARGGRECQRKQRFLFQLVRFCGTGGRAGAGGTFDGAKAEAAFLNELCQTRHDVEKRTHVAGLLLNPDDLSGVRVGVQSGGNFRSRKRV